MTISCISGLKCRNLDCRDISLNLRLTTERAAALCVDGHICELQLIPLRFAELKVCSSEFP